MYVFISIKINCHIDRRLLQIGIFDITLYKDETTEYNGSEEETRIRCLVKAQADERLENHGAQGRARSYPDHPAAQNDKHRQLQRQGDT